MNKRVKRGVLSALLISLLAPFFGLLYVHKPFKALLCALIALGVFTAQAFFGIFSVFDGAAAGLGILALVWVYSVIASVRGAWRGLTPEVAAHDIGPWIVAWLVVMILAAATAWPQPYRLYSMGSPAMKPFLAEGEYVLVLPVTPEGFGESSRNMPARSLAPASLKLGDVVIIHLAGQPPLIRRLAGLPGDVLEVKGGLLFRNGASQSVGFLPANQLPGGEIAWVVPEDTVLAVADAGMTGYVDKSGGAYPLRAITGKALYVAWSGDWKRLGAEL